MAFPVQVTFRNMSQSDGIEAYIRDRAKELETFCPDILGCHVVVALPHHHHGAGNRTRIEIDLTIPGRHVVVSHDPSTHAALRDNEESEHAKGTEPAPEHRDAYLTIHDAFDAARRQIQDYARRRRGDVKTHQTR
jgi:ribosome-associated translation inhibitor RaiA